VMSKGGGTGILSDFVEQFIVPQRDKPKSFSGSIPWCRIEDFNGKYLSQSKSGKCVTEEQIKEMPLRVFPKGTVIVSCSADLGRCAIVELPLVTNQTFIGLVPKKDLLPEYLYYSMINRAKELNSIATGATIKYLSKKKFQNLEFSIPPLEEQQRIVNILDEAYENIDNSKNIVQTACNSLKEIIETKLHVVFHKDSADWKKIPFEESIVKVKATPKIKKKEFKESGSYPVVSQEKDHINGYWNSADDLLTIQTPVVVFGDHTKTLKYINFDFVRGADGLKVFQPIESILPKFFYHQLRSVKIENLGYARHYRLLKQIQIRVPSIERQHEIASMFDELDEQVSQLNNLYERESHIFEELRHSILQEAFIGKLTGGIAD